MTSVTFTRALVTGSPADLTISNVPHGNPYWLDEDGVIEPEIEHRTAFADESAHVSGSLGLTVYTLAADEATLKAQKRALEAVVSQFTYTATLTTVGGPDAYTCLPGRLSWGTLDSGMVKARLAKAVITIPVQPLEA